MGRTVLSLSFVFMFLLLLGSVTAIGVTPPRIIADDVLKGSTIEQSVMLVDVQKGDTVSISFSGQGSEWVSSSKGNEFLIEGSDETIPFTLTVPAAAPNGQYEVIAQLTVTPSSQNEGGATTASVISGIQVSLQFTVTGEEVRKYHVRSVSIPDIEVDMPLAVVTSLKNEGNVLVKPSTIEVDIKDKETKEILYAKSASPKEHVGPFLVGSSIATFSVDLDEDLYFADVRVYDQGEIIFTETDLPFDVVPRGSLQASVELIELTVQENIIDLAKITGMLQNTGSSGVFVALEAEVYYDDVLVDALESDELYLNEGEQQEISLLYTPTKKGDYKVSAQASFSGKKSKIKEVVFNASPTKGHGSNTLLIILTLVLFFASLALGIIGTKKKRGKHKTQDGVSLQEGWSV